MYAEEGIKRQIIYGKLIIEFVSSLLHGFGIILLYKSESKFFGTVQRTFSSNVVCTILVTNLVGES